MILAIDVGNTNIVAAIMEKGKVTCEIRFETGKKEGKYYHYNKLSKFVRQCCDSNLSGSVISSVVPSVNEYLIHACEKITGKQPVMVNYMTARGMKVIYDNPEKLGADLIADAYGATVKYHSPVCVVDIGTATTFSVVNSNNEYIGSVITPGPYTAINALTKSAALLPKSRFSVSDKIVGNNTLECMNIGVFTAHAAMIDGMIDRIREDLGEDMKFVVTGGPARTITPLCRHKVFYDHDLLHYGMYCIYENASNNADNMLSIGMQDNNLNA